MRPRWPPFTCATRPAPDGRTPAMLTPPAPYTLRAMTPDDLDAVQAIDRLSFPTPTKTAVFSYEITQNRLAHYTCLLRGGEVVGFAGCWVMGDEMHVSTIATHPAQRRRGLGELLLLDLLLAAYAQPVTLVTLEVRRSNAAAQALYRKYKFDVVGERPRYYRDTGEDALIMTRTPLDAPYYQFLRQQQETLVARLVAEG